MTDHNIRQQLIDYLLDNLEDAERQAIEAELARDANLRRELKVLEARFDVLRDRAGQTEPPPGLASRTLSAIDAYEAEHQVTPVKKLGKLSPTGGTNRISSFRLADVVAAAGICLVAGMLFFPAIANSRFHSQVGLCQDNLRRVGVALQSYNSYYHGVFPAVPTDGNLSFAGSYVVTLNEGQFIDDPAIFLCPAAPADERIVAWKIPSRSEIEQACGGKLTWLRERAGGSYGYTLGYLVNNEYHPTVNRGRPTFAIMSDAPSSQAADGGSADVGSANHLGIGHNVLYEDFHVQYVTQTMDERCGDAFFENRWGLQAAGVDEDDAVIGRSATSPVIFSGP